MANDDLERTFYELLVDSDTPEKWKPKTSAMGGAQNTNDAEVDNTAANGVSISANPARQTSTSSMTAVVPDITATAVVSAVTSKAVSRPPASVSRRGRALANATKSHFSHFGSAKSEQNDTGSSSVFAAMLKKHGVVNDQCTNEVGAVNDKYTNEANQKQENALDSAVPKQENEAMNQNVVESRTTRSRVQVRATVLHAPSSQLGGFVVRCADECVTSRFALRTWRIRDNALLARVIDLNDVPSAKRQRMAKSGAVKRFDFATPSRDDRFAIQQNRLDLRNDVDGRPSSGTHTNIHP
jgi:hypothetical protein